MKNTITLSAKHTIETALMNAVIQLTPKPNSNLLDIERANIEEVLNQLQNAQRKLDTFEVIEESKAA